MHSLEFLEDLAVIMLLAGFMAVLFNRLRQPVVLGYILAGIIVGPHTPPFSFIKDPQTINIFAELGIVFLMFFLGLEFNFRKLLKVGIAAFVAAIAEIILMVWVGYEIGLAFKWQPLDALFLGAMLAISSTTIIVKALQELGLKNYSFVQLTFGILIIEDILAIGILAVLSGIATQGQVNAGDVFAIFTKLTLFLVATITIGILTVPRLLAYVAKLKNDELLLVTTLGLCFGFCLVVIKLNYSIALGAFIMGAIIAESRQLPWIERLIEPLRDMFSAVFFVSVGLLLDPQVLVDYALPIFVITVAVIVGKVVACSLGTFIVGQNGRNALRVGMSLAQIGEFSFIIATLGITLKVTSSFLYSVAVAVSIITTFLTPYLIRLADPLAAFIEKAMPKTVREIFTLYTVWLRDIKLPYSPTKYTRIIRKRLFYIIANLVLIALVFIAGSYSFNYGDLAVWLNLSNELQERILIWGISVLVSTPFLIIIYNQLKILSEALSALKIKKKNTSHYNSSVRHTLSQIIPVAASIGVIFLLMALSATILSPFELLILMSVILLLICGILWVWFKNLHKKLENIFVKENKK